MLYQTLVQTGLHQIYYWDVLTTSRAFVPFLINTNEARLWTHYISHRIIEHILITFKFFTMSIFQSPRLKSLSYKGQELEILLDQDIQPIYYQQWTFFQEKFQGILLQTPRHSLEKDCSYPSLELLKRHEGSLRIFGNFNELIEAIFEVSRHHRVHLPGRPDYDVILFVVF